MSFTREQVVQIYVATFNRAPDSAGLDYWMNDSGLTNIKDVASSFFDSMEATLLYPPATSTIANVESAYKNLFGRSADADGLAYWVAELDSGRISQSLMLQAIINGAQNSVEFGNDATLIANKTTVGLSFADAGLDDTTLAATIISNITADSLGVENAINIISLSNTNYGLGELSNSSTYGVLELDSGIQWFYLYDTVTYSFNSSIPTEYYDYSNSDKLTQGWTALNYEQENAVRSVMQEADKLIALNLEEVSSDGYIQYNIVEMEQNVSGFSFESGLSHDYLGDIFLTAEYNTQSGDYGLEIGEWGYFIIIHELGHALGLKHPFEEPNVLPDSLDNVNHTIMSYTNINSYIPILSFSSTQIFIDYKSLNPQFFSIYDIAALQAIYGVNETTNLEDNTYSSSYTDYTLMTIWDAGGEDTIDLSQTTGSSTIDLRAGSLNSADQQTLQDVISLQQDIAIENGKSEYSNWIAQNITDLYNTNDLYTGINNLGISVGTVIENVTTGSGNDIVTDNEVNNIIKTLAGDDNIYLGNGGMDYIDGGDGYDILHLDLFESDISISNTLDGTYTILADVFTVDFIDIEGVQLNDGMLLI